MFFALVEGIRGAISEARSKLQQDIGLTRTMRRSGKSISMGPSTSREKTARAKAEKYGRDPGTAQKKADYRQTLKK